MSSNFSIPKRAVVASLLLVLVVSPGAAVANNTTNGTATPETTSSGSSSPVTIDNNTRIIATEYLSDRGVARVTIESDVPQDLFIADAGVRRGVVPTRSISIKPNDPRTFEIPVEETDRGAVLLSISTQDVLYRTVIKSKTDDSIIGGPWTYSDVQLVAVLVALGTSVGTGIMLLRSRLDLDVEPERVA